MVNSETLIIDTTKPYMNLTELKQRLSYVGITVEYEYQYTQDNKCKGAIITFKGLPKYPNPRRAGRHKKNSIEDFEIFLFRLKDMGLEDLYFNRSIDNIKRNIAKHGVEKIAKAFNISPSTLRRRIKKAEEFGYKNLFL